MIFAPQNTKLYSFINESLIRPPELKEVSNNNDNRKERFYQQLQKI